MDEITFVIAPHEYGAGRATGVEPVLNGVSVPDLFKRVDGVHPGYTGMAPPEPVLERWRTLLEAGGNDTMRILGCGCGDWDCASARVRVDVVGETITWSNFWGSSPPTGDQRARVYDELGTYEFDRADYEAALANPVHAERFIREEPDLDRLRAGYPGEPRAWLREMTMGLGPDFHSPHAPDSTREVFVAGLGALREQGRPVTEGVVREWAQHLRFTEDYAERSLERFRQVGGSSEDAE